ncbi:glycosyltransferase family 4 protein [Cryobacterium lyxosi]|nr:glycosyltransferase family 4 protein [Cryobacterium lyxosi]
MKIQSIQEVLVFYPFFPTYRRSILETLAQRTDIKFNFAAGVQGRAEIQSLSVDDFPHLHQLRTRKLGQVSLNPGAVRIALCSKYDTVILAPATLSVSVWCILILRRLNSRNTYLWGQCGKPGATGLKRRTQEVMNRLATGLLVYGESERNGATSHGTPATKVQIVNNAVEHEGSVSQLGPTEFDATSSRRGIGNDAPNLPISIAFVGRITPQKRLDALVDAVQLLSQKYPLITATIVGDGTALPALRQRVKTGKLPVQFLGAIHDSERLRQVFESATIVVAPSEIGLLAVDAMLHGVPVLYGDNPLKNGPEVEALTLGVNAATFTPGDPRSIADAVEMWISRAPHIKPATYREAAITALRTWSPESVALNIAAAVGSKTRHP